MEFKQLKAILSLFSVLQFAAFGEAVAQTCSVNAGVPSTVCVSATSFSLVGNATGALATTATWSLVSGPNVPIITSPTSATTTVTGFVAGTYIFSYSATCSDAALAADSVTVTVNPLPVFTAGNDTFVCGSNLTMKATLPLGASGVWSSSFITGSGASDVNFAAPTSPVTTASLGTFGTNCPKPINVIWTVTQGACTSRDTAIISFGAELALSAIPDRTICGTTFSSNPFYQGCGGSIVTTQLSGPSTATIGYANPLTSGNNILNISSMITGDYVFAMAITRCSGSIFRDTFKLTIGSTVGLTAPNIFSKSLCPEQFDSVYYFEPTVALLPGEKITWNLVPTYRIGSTPNPTADTIGNILRLRNTVHPDSTTALENYVYGYTYTISNGACSQSFPAYLYLYSPLREKAFVATLNLPCGTTSANIAQPVSGSAASYSFRNVIVLTKPAGAPNPTYLATGSTINVSGLRPGKYVFSFEYYRGFVGCDVKTAIVEVNVGAAGGLANAGTHQILPCGVDTTVLAGNIPPAGQLGTWELVSGPSTVVLANPHSASLIIRTLLPGAYTFRWAISNGTTCSATSDIMNVVVTPLIPVVDAGADKIVCYGYSIPLKGTSFGLGTTGLWTQISGPSVTIANPNAANTTISGTVAGTVYGFSYTLTNVCGADTDTIEITTGASQGPSDAAITTVDQCLTTSSTTLSATAPTSGAGAWSQVSGPSAATIVSPASTTTAITGMIGGEYKFKWEVTAAGCDTLRDTVSVAYRTSTITANAGADRYLCQDTFNLNAIVPTTGIGTWTQTGGPLVTIANPNAANSNVTGLLAGSVYDFRWTVKLGACSTATDDVHVVVSAPPSVAKAMNDTTICGLTLAIGGSINLPLKAETPASGIGSWGIIETPFSYSSTGNTIADIGSPNTSIRIIGGHYILYWQVSNGACATSVDTVRIDLVPKADAGAATVNVCEKTAQDMRGTEPATGTVLWSQISGPTTATITNPTNVFTAILDMIPGIYKFKYEITHPTTGCSSFDTVTINNGKLIVANAGRDSIFCWNPSGATTLYLRADTPSAGTGIWVRTSGTGTLSYSPNANANPTIANVNQPGLHQFSWTVTNGGCQSKDYKDIVVEKLTVPTINFSPLTTCRDSFTVSVTSPYSNFNYDWSFPQGKTKDTSGFNLTGPLFNYFKISDTNNIYLTITNPVTGCKAKDSTSVIVDCAYLPLPLSLLSFEAQKLNETKALLNWQTGVETNVFAIVIQHSKDGMQWQSISRQASKGSNSDYSHMHSSPVNGLNLYRLKIEDRDGTYSYSPTRSLTFSGLGNISFQLTPNPAVQTVNLEANAGTLEGATVQFINSAGQVMMNTELTTTAKTISYDISVLPKGLYIVRVSISGTTYTLNLVVQ